MIDVEAAIVAGPSTHTKIVAVLVGAAGVLAALLTLVEGHAGRAEERALLMSARLTAEASGQIPASQAFNSFGLQSSQNAVLRQSRGNARQLAALEMGAANLDFLTALAEAEIAAGERLAAIAVRMATLPDERGPLDQHTFEVLQGDIAAASDLVTRQGEQVDLAERWAARGSRAVLALSVLAVAAVLLGFAGAVSLGRAGTVSLGAASVFLLLSAAIGAAAAFG